jgi:hypothetical protein
LPIASCSALSTQDPRAERHAAISQERLRRKTHRRPCVLDRHHPLADEARLELAVINAMMFACHSSSLPLTHSPTTPAPDGLG